MLHRQRNAHASFFEIEEEEAEVTDDSGVFAIEEERFDIFILDTMTLAQGHSLQSGLRVETTRYTQEGHKQSETELFPSVHYLFQKDLNQLRFSLARTIRRHDFRELTPFVQHDIPREGQNTYGNPQLKPEFALGLDLGFEKRFRQWEGIIGVNLFYRDITDHVETLQVGEDTFRMENAGDGEVYGLEFDLGLPLTGIGLSGLSLFANLSLQDSSLTDPYTGEKRRFNLQSERVFNLSLLYTLPSARLSFGLNWLTQGQADEILLTERSVIEYGDNLELLIEKKFEKMALRLMARNLADAERIVTLEEYEGLWTEGDLIASGLEKESSGRSIFLTLRTTFSFR